MHLSAFKEHKKDFQDYQMNFEKYKDTYTKLLQNIELNDLKCDKFEQLTNNLDELNYEIQLLKQKLKTAEGKNDSLQKQLDDAGYSDLVQKIAFLELLIVLQENIEMQKMLIMEEDRLIFKEILVNTIGKKSMKEFKLAAVGLKKCKNI